MDINYRRICIVIALVSAIFIVEGISASEPWDSGPKLAIAAPSQSHACHSHHSTEGPLSMSLPLWGSVPDREFERRLQDVCKAVKSIDELVVHLKAAKAPYTFRYPEKSDPEGPMPFVSIWIKRSLRSANVYFDKDSRIIKQVYFVNTYL
jgi:hypothetical protein